MFPSMFLRLRISLCVVGSYQFIDGINYLPHLQYIVNGKKIEIAVKQIVSGSTMKPSGTVANPESLQLYYKYKDTETAVKAAKGIRSKL